MFWLIDPEGKTIQVFDLEKETEMPVATHFANSVFESRLLPGLLIKAEEMFCGAG